MLQTFSSSLSANQNKLERFQAIGRAEELGHRRQQRTAAPQVRGRDHGRRLEPRLLCRRPRRALDGDGRRSTQARASVLCVG